MPKQHRNFTLADDVVAILDTSENRSGYIEYLVRKAEGRCPLCGQLPCPVAAESTPTTTGHPPPEP